MSRLHPLRRGRRALGALLAGVLSIGSVAVMATAAGAVPPIEAPEASNLSINFTTPTDGLLPGDVVTFEVNTSGGAVLSAVQAKLCVTGFTSYGGTSYGANGPTGVRCVNTVGTWPANGINPATGLDADPGPGTGTPTYVIDPIPQDTGSSGPLNFTAGTGSVTWRNSTGHGPVTLTCDAANPCDLVVQVDYNQAPTQVWYIQTLTYAGDPHAPTGLAVDTVGNTSLGVSWDELTFPDETGNSPIDFYTVRAIGAGCAGPAGCTVDTPDGSTTTATIGGLTPFAAYDLSVRATNEAGFTGPYSSPAVPGTPAPGGPTSVGGSPANESVLLSWSFSGPTPTQFVITPYTEPGHTPLAEIPTGSTSLSFLVPGLTNGQQYTFGVQAEYGVGERTVEGLSGTIIPQGKFIQQQILVTRPNGDLVLTQACAGSDPYPDDLSDVVYPTGNAGPSLASCTVDLGTARLIKTGPGAGQYFEATGAIHQVTVVDTRDADEGWDVTASVSQFTDGPKNFSCNGLGWDPLPPDDTEPFTSPDGPYDQVATEGAVIPPATLAPNGLCDSQELATAAAGSGLGIAYLDADLTLWIPVFIQSGNYSAMMTITAA